MDTADCNERQGELSNWRYEWTQAEGLVTLGGTALSRLFVGSFIMERHLVEAVEATREAAHGHALLGVDACEILCVRMWTCVCVCHTASMTVKNHHWYNIPSVAHAHGHRVSWTTSVIGQ